MARFTSRNTTISFQDGSGNSVAVGPGPGDLSISTQNADNAERVRVMDRLQFDGHVLGADLEQDCSVSVQLPNQSVTDATQLRVYDFIQKTGSFASRASTSSDIASAWRTVVTMTDGTTTATFTLPVCTGGFDFSEGAEGHTFSISFQNNGTIVVA
jgi:hypothetical protein|tara:strand:- start:3137 stop:3604 length:468 start_codon:yes stop_codon:yes gene_type:complete